MVGWKDFRFEIWLGAVSLSLGSDGWFRGLLCRVAIGESGVESLDKGVGFFLLLVTVAPGVIEMSLAFDGGVLQRIGPSAKLARA